MQRFGIGVLLALGLVGGWIAAAHAQLSPKPSPAPGVTQVSGEVAISNRPTVLARQDGTWTVTCTTPAPAPAIVAPGERVAITYLGGVRETVQVDTVRNGWFTTGRRRINLSNVAVIEPQ